MSADAAYLDSSALVKLVVREAESDPLARHLNERSSLVSCALARVEVTRAVREQGPAAITRAKRLLERVALIRLDDALLDAAAALDGPLRSLDAIHLAAAQALGDDLAEVITYDQRMAGAASELGMRTAAPT